MGDKFSSTAVRRPPPNPFLIFSNIWYPGIRKVLRNLNFVSCISTQLGPPSFCIAFNRLSFFAFNPFALFPKIVNFVAFLLLAPHPLLVFSFGPSPVPGAESGTLMVVGMGSWPSYSRGWQMGSSFVATEKHCSESWHPFLKKCYFVHLHLGV